MIGICIKYQNKNYGSSLQSFAFVKFLETNSVDYEIIRYKRKRDFKFLFSAFFRLFNSVLINDKKEAFDLKLAELLHRDFKRGRTTREKEFSEFANKYFTHLSPVLYGYSNLENYSKKYDAVISGSDQLWSPAGLPTHFYTLEFCNKDQNTISFASSFGVSYIPWYQIKRTQRFLRRIKHISVREESGAKIIKNLIQKDVTLVCDPVLLLSRESWDKLIPVHSQFQFEYVFAYFLGKNKQYRAEVTRFAKKNNLKIVTLKFLDQYVTSDKQFGDYSSYEVDPADFLNLIRGATFVFTDSFHGMVLSTIYEKQFLVFNRYSNKQKVSKNTRIDSFLNLTGLNERRFNGNIYEVKNKINYSAVEPIVFKFRNDSANFLLNSLNKLNNDRN